MHHTITWTSCLPAKPNKPCTTVLTIAPVARSHHLPYYHTDPSKMRANWYHRIIVPTANPPCWLSSVIILSRVLSKMSTALYTRPCISVSAATVPFCYHRFSFYYKHSLPAQPGTPASLYHQQLLSFFLIVYRFSSSIMLSHWQIPHEHNPSPRQRCINNYPADPFQMSVILSHWHFDLKKNTFCLDDCNKPHNRPLFLFSFRPTICMRP